MSYKHLYMPATNIHAATAKCASHAVREMLPVIPGRRLAPRWPSFTLKNTISCMQNFSIKRWHASADALKTSARCEMDSKIKAAGRLCSARRILKLNSFFCCKFVRRKHKREWTGSRQWAQQAREWKSSPWIIRICVSGKLISGRGAWENNEKEPTLFLYFAPFGCEGLSIPLCSKWITLFCSGSHEVNL